MNTPICDFVKQYAEETEGRFHMPGHKGTGFLGVEHLDLTEISGADSLFEADGIIRQSEENASDLFGSFLTLYSTEGSSLVIRAMLYMAMKYAARKGRGNRILAGRNAHKTFVTGAALLGMEVSWISGNGYLSCSPSKEQMETLLEESARKQCLPSAVYLTSPDYLGNMCDIRGISEVCRKYEVLFLVDNAHGAYLHFLKEPVHPLDLGADLCSDSAHKTLPVLTGGAYLQIACHAAELFGLEKEPMRLLGKQAMSVFASTSPSYLILQSLDHANLDLAESYPSALQNCAQRTAGLKKALRNRGYELYGQEDLKLTVCPKAYGYTGQQLAGYLRGFRMECEFADPDFLVCMFTPANDSRSLQRLKEVLLDLEPKTPIAEKPPLPSGMEQVLSMQEALFSMQETVPAEESAGRILGALTVGCPPAVPIVMCGERITPEAVQAFRYYGIEEVSVIKEAR